MYFDTHNRILIAIVLILASTLYLEVTPSPHLEIISEGFCWGLIFICGAVYLRFFPDAGQSRLRLQQSSLNSFALCTSLLCLSRSVRVMNWSMGPLLSPILFITQSLYTADTQLPKVEEPQSLFNKIDKTKALCHVLPTIATVLILSKDNFFDSFNLQLCWLLSQAGIYFILHSWTLELEPGNGDDVSQILHMATEIAPRIVAITGSISLIWWQGIPSVLDAAIMIGLKSVRWVALLVLVFKLKISALPFVTVFVVCTNAIHLSTHAFQSFLVLIAATISLYLITVAVLQSRIAKIVILTFAIFPFRSFLVHQGLTLHSISLHQHHPIHYLVDEARTKFERTQKDQSRSLTVAVAEYVRRYGHQPPPGFDKWYNFAVANNVIFIDEYDFMTHSVDPYWSVTPRVLRDYIHMAESTAQNYRLGVLEIRDHKAQLFNGNFQHDQLIQLLQPVLDFLPDMKILLNDLDEPRVVVPHDLLRQSESSTSPNILDISDSPDNTRPFSFINLDHQKSFDTITLSCPPDSPARSPSTQIDHENAVIPFISNITKARDICQFSHEQVDQHGFLSSPSSFQFTHQKLPIASTAKISSFQDILIPSSYYFQDDIAEYKESWDIPWEEKKDVVYWRGSGTGGHWHDGTWRHGHRQRFVNFTNSLQQEVQLMHQTKPKGPWTVYNSTIGEMGNYFQVNFSNFFQCDGEDCAEQREKFHQAPKDTLEDSYKYKVLYNIDGNSFSGRYYRFLKSNSLVFMQNLFKEWHEDRLIPWVHYVPVSLEMEELPETTRYLLNDTEGQEIAARIARDSRDWARQTLRPIDLSAALLRILLEYSRLLQDDRDTVGCCG